METSILHNNYFTSGQWKHIRDLSFSYSTHTKEMKRLGGGPFIKEMIHHFDGITGDEEFWSARSLDLNIN